MVGLAVVAVIRFGPQINEAQVAPEARRRQDATSLREAAARRSRLRRRLAADWSANHL